MAQGTNNMRTTTLTRHVEQREHRDAVAVNADKHFANSTTMHATVLSDVVSLISMQQLCRYSILQVHLY